MESNRISNVLPWASVPLGVLVAVGVLLFAPVDRAAASMLAITLFCILLWIATPVPPAVTGMLCVGLIGIVFSPELAFVGFQSAALWLVVFGLLLGEATRQSGLTSAGTRWILARSWPNHRAGQPLPETRAYRRLLGGLGLATVALAFLVPSALVRILTIAPILAELADSFESDRARAGIFLGPTLVTFYATPGIFTAGLPNIVIVGIAESLGVTSITWSAWTAQMFAVMGLGRALVIVAVVYVLFRPRGEASVTLPSSAGGTSASQRRMLVYLTIGISFWVTDFVHGLHPVFGALLVVLLSLLPEIGVVSLDELADVDLSIVFFLGAILAIGSGMTRTGVTDTAATSLLAFLPDGAPLPVVLLLVFGVSMAMMLLMEGLAVASVLTPVLVSYARDVSIPVAPVLMTESVALNTPIFPYQSAVLVAILGEDIVGMRQLIWAAVWGAILTILVLLPLQVLLFGLVY